MAVSTNKRLEWDVKDPDEVIDMDLKWTKSLTDAVGVADSITTSTWTVVVGTVDIDDDEFTPVITKVWLSGGTLGENCELLNRITTALGRTLDQTVYLKIRKR